MLYGFPFSKAIHELVKENGLNYGDYDLVSVKGGAGNFEQLKRTSCELAKRLHNPQMIILTVHEDCGAKATQTDLEKAVVISKEIFGNDIPIIEKYLKLMLRVI